MIIDYVSNLSRYKGISAQLDLAIDHLISGELVFEADRAVLDGDDVYVNRQSVALEEAAGCRWEVHYEHLDIHVPLDNTEYIGFLNNADGLTWTDINREADCDFSDDKEEPEIAALKPGMCAVIWPGEPHKPNIGSGLCRKYVAKVRVNFPHD